MTRLPRLPAGSFLPAAILSIAGFAPLALANVVTDPVPQPIVKSGIAVKLVDYVTVPPSNPVPPLARVSVLYPAPDNSGRLFVNDLRGTLYVIEQGLISTYLDVASQYPAFVASPGLATGFQGFTFHPNFASNGKLYTTHTETPGASPPDLVSPTTVTPVLHSIVTEWTATDASVNLFSGSSRELLRIEQPTFIHGVQEIGFNTTVTALDPDYGLLYIGQGDGGELLTTNPQGLDSPHGSILRIDPFGNNSANGQYGIPADNPFAADSDPQTLDEIWAWGFRNPHRFSWDSGGSNKMLIGEIGQGNIEEVNLGGIGNNYGWNEREGTFVFDPNMDDIVQTLPPNDATLGYTYPVAQYDHDEGDAIVGGFVYRGTRAPVLTGKYVFGDIVRGRVFLVEESALVDGSQAAIDELTLLDQYGLEITLLDITPGGRVDLRFGTDANGELYVMSKRDGIIRRVFSAAPDSDGDGLADDVETVLGTNINLVDTDGDGVSDFDELNRDGEPSSYTAGVDTDPGSDPNTGIDPGVADPKDTDGDGLQDDVDPEPTIPQADIPIPPFALAILAALLMLFGMRDNKKGT